MEVKVIKEYYSVKMCREHPTWLFIYGDNWLSVGKGGQAIIRDEPNSFGISSKYSCAESYSDKRMYDNRMAIKIETDLLLDIADKYEAIVFPFNGLGTGLAQLPKLAPRTFIHLSLVLLDKFGFNNLQGLHTN